MSDMIRNKDIEIEDIQKITELLSHIKLLEKKLLRYEPVLEYATESVQISDENGNIIFVNKNFTQSRGIPAEERIGKNIFELNPDGILAQVLRERKPIVNAITTAPGMNRYGLASAYPVFQGDEFLGAVIFGKDYSQTVHLSHKLDVRESFLTEMYRRTSQYSFLDLSCNSSRMKDTMRLIKEVAKNDNPLALIGEVGTEKEVLAQVIHSGSIRKNKPFFRFNCSMFTERKANYELFGYEKNAFPEAVTSKVGLLELVNGGTIFLENFHDLSISVQIKLFQSLKEEKILKIGASIPNAIDVRVIVSFNSAVGEIYNKGLVTDDFYYYLKNHCIEMPPLRERKEDISGLVHSCISKISKETGRQVKGINKDALDLLNKYDWPGNVDELELMIKMLLITYNTDTITMEQVLSKLPIEVNAQLDDKLLTLEEVEKIAILKAIRIYGNSVDGKKKAADALQVSLGTLYNKIRKYGL